MARLAGVLQRAKEYTSGWGKDHEHMQNTSRECMLIACKLSCGTGPTVHFQFD